MTDQPTYDSKQIEKDRLDAIAYRALTNSIYKGLLTVKLMTDSGVTPTNTYILQIINDAFDAAQKAITDERNKTAIVEGIKAWFNSLGTEDNESA